MIRVATSALLLLAAVSASPLWLRPDAPPLGQMSTDPRLLAEYLLPTALIPSQYEVTLIPYLKSNAPTPEQEFTFDGTVKITLTCSEATSEIVMHAYDITIADKTAIQVMAEGSTEALAIKEIAFTENVKDGKQFFTITMEQPLEVATQYEVAIVFKGKLNEDLEGFYKSSYTENGQEKYAMSTVQLKIIKAQSSNQRIKHNGNFKKKIKQLEPSKS